MESLPQQEGSPLNLRQTILEILDDKKKTSGRSEERVVEIKLENIPLTESPEILQNITLLRNLTGQRGADLRRLIEGATPEAHHLRELQEWSLRAAKGEAVGTEILITPPPASIANVDGEHLYEKISFLERNPDTDRTTYDAALVRKAAEAVGIRTEKWVDLVDAVFGDPRKIKKLIETIGFIPEELYTKKKFKNVPSEKIVASIESLRALEQTPLRNEALHERAKAINHLFISRRAEGIRGKERQNITLDSNGLFINLINFHTHLPYALVRDEMLAELEHGNWLARESLDEVRIQRANANNEPSSAAEIAEKQAKAFDARFYDQYDGDRIRSWGKMTDIVARAVIEDGAFIPDSWLQKYTSPENLAHLMRLAERITVRESGGILTKETGIFSGYSAREASKEEYEIRSKILNNPAYYNVIKIVQHFLRHVPEKAEGEYAVFRGHYKKSPSGDQHSFIEMVHQGKVSRVLINEEKHVPPDLKRKFDSLALFSRKEYDNLENALRAFNAFCTSLDELITNIDILKSEFTLHAENCVHFVLSNVSEKYSTAAKLFESLQDSDENDSAFISFMEGIKSDYSAFLYQNARSERSFVENFSPEIRIDDITFGADFLAQVKANSPQDFSEEVSSAPFPIRLVTLDYRINDPSQTIPFHVEESCLDALRVDRGRPLINVIGGCKALDTVKNPLRLFSESVMRVAHGKRANVAVPGSQSGIGTEFGLQNIHYKNHYGHLPRAEQAHVFAVNPGGSVFYPGNPFFDKTTLAAAQTSVDSIVTPICAGWEKTGTEKRSSRYPLHVAYMEALYRRISADQPYATVVGNGGLYSIMEINECLKGNTKLLLTRDSGRFAEVAATLLPHADTLASAKNLDTTILAILREALHPKTLQEFCEKDFGSDETPESADYEVYREHFNKFLKIAAQKQRQIFVTSLSSLEEDLAKALGRK